MTAIWMGPGSFQRMFSNHLHPASIFLAQQLVIPSNRWFSMPIVDLDPVRDH